MRKLLLFTLLILAQFSFAQEKAITGIVQDASGTPLPGVVLVVPNTTKGTTTGIDGKFNLTLAPEDKQIVARLVGYQQQVIGVANLSNITITLQEDVETLEEVVVTALGVSRDKKALGYSVQQVSSESMNTVDPLSLGNSIQGKVAGVQIKGGSGNVGASTSVVIRGNASLGGSNQPLWVVDGTPISNYNISNSTDGYDFGNGAQDINPDDVESVSVLKGAAATALYGSRAANGVILVTTKKGKKKSGIGIEVNSMVTFDNVYILPEFQNEYGGGYELEFPTFDYAASGLGPEWEKFDGTPVVEAGADESWGPRMDGQQVLAWHSFVPESDTYNQTVPFSPQPNNYRDLFNTGVTTSNSVALSGGDETSTFRLGWTNVTQKGVVPNSNMQKNTITFRGTKDLNDRLKGFFSGSYVSQQTTGRTRFGYSGSGDNVVAGFRQWSQRQLDVDKLRELQYSDAMGQQVGWNMRSLTDGRTYLRWANNPFWTLNNIFAKDSKNRFFGNAGLSYNIAKGLDIKATARTDYYGLLTKTQKGTANVDGIANAYAGESTRNSFENNFELIATYNERFGDVSLNVVGGGNILYIESSASSASTADGLILEDFYHISNSVSPANVFSSVYKKQMNSLFGSASVGYKDMVFVDASIRNDWSSTLPVDNNSYFYPAVSTSFIFSELLGDQDILSFGKLRAGYAKVGLDAAAYGLYKTYDATSFGTLQTFSANSVLPSGSQLVNESTTEYEVGLETSFFNGRLSAEGTYFHRTSSDQILNVTLPSSTGYTSKTVNSGELVNKGYELLVNIVPVQTDDFRWDLGFNYTALTSEVTKLFGDLEEYRTAYYSSSGWANAVVGEEYGQVTMRRGHVFHENGERLVGDNGRYVYENVPYRMGSFMPDANGGVTTKLSYKGLTLSAQIDFQVGGLIYSTANRWAYKSGLAAGTVGLNDKGNPIRDAVADGGGIKVEGVNEDGQPNETYIEAWRYFADQAYYFTQEFVDDASYVKLRDMKLGYTLPSSLTKKIGIPSASVAVFGRNLALLYDNADGYDPEQVMSISNTQGVESGSIPSTRSIGFNVNLKF
ncbi:SusC/RagA family TonB-linked outer membrane protein [Algivirga pacifica]|uniref:SusC/RagA family TonB-linked outer membrane protein n=1 Tax=Algivirga pacifica TaxID=1162670 RepID=A0ABP9CY38_9BACT